MNKEMIKYSIYKIMTVGALLMILPIIVSIYFGEELRVKLAFIVTMTIMLLISLPLGRKKPENTRIYVLEGLIITALSWIILSIFAASPYYLSGEIPSLIDAFFEAASGLTTTGASIINDVESISNSVLFWRSFTHLIGGMGVLVLAMAILPEISTSSMQIMKAEVPGPKFGKLLPRLKDSARILYIIYLGMTVLLIISLVFAGMPIFDSILNAMATAGTGGFAPLNNSIAGYNSASIELILSIGMLLFGVNFNLYYLLLVKKNKKVFRSEELRSYLAIVAGATLIILINIYPIYNSIIESLRNAFFTVSSVITTTGFATEDFDMWPTLSKNILLLLMFVGGCAGSTAGGIKVSRIIIFFKSAINEVRRIINPKRYLSVSFEGKSLDKVTETGISNYIFVYAFFFIGMSILVSLESHDLETTLSAVAATFNNVGPGMGMVGPTGNYAAFTGFTKFILSITMIAGRLELFPIIILFSPKLWKNN